MTGNQIHQVGGAQVAEAASITHNAGAGGYKFKSAGDVNYTTLGKTDRTFAQQRMSTFALNDLKTILAGVDNTTVLVGSMVRTVAAGAGISDTVTTGNLLQTVGTGNMTVSIATGNLAATVGTGNLALTAGAGTVTITGGATTSVIAAGVLNLTAPTVKIGAAIVGSAVAGSPGPPAPHRDYIVGIPILGVPTITIG